MWIRSQDKDTLTVIRMIKASLKQEQIEKKILVLSTYFMVMTFLGISVFYLFDLPNVQYFFIEERVDEYIS